MKNIYLIIVLAPLVGAIIAGFLGGKIGRKGAHWVASSGVGISTLLSFYVLKRFLFDGQTRITSYNVCYTKLYDPHQLIEGMILAGYAIGATRGYNYIRGEFWEPYERFEHALQEASYNFV